MLSFPVLDRYWEDPDRVLRILKLPDSNSSRKTDQHPQSPSSSNHEIATCST